MLLSELAPLVRAQQGTIYQMATTEDEGDILRLLGSYATTREQSQRIAVGSGLVGQCAREKQRIMLNEVPADYTPVRSSLGAARPANIVVLPVLFEGETKAVIELASLHQFTQAQLTFLEQLTESIGVVLNTIEATMRTENLLLQSQQLTAELQSGQKELQQTNDELEQKAKQLAEQNAEVERKNKEIELARRALEEKAAELALTSKYKSEFLANMSHELRTPLNSILGFSEILSAELYGPLGAPQYKEYAEIIRGSGKKLLKLVNQVLEIGRLEGLELDVGPEMLEPAFDDAIASARSDFGRGVQPVIVSEGEPPLVLADPWGLRTVLTHLLQNAAMFSPDDGEVRLRVVSRDGQVDIFVEDDGEGVDPAELPRLMRPFEQGENALVRRAEGAGLGLPICELTCRAMGARLTLTSAPGKGMSARIRLKAA
jgi:signal transduction histidine kinase